MPYKQTPQRKTVLGKKIVALYLCCNPVRDICLHCAHVLFGIINSYKEVSSFPIQVIIQLQSVEER